MKHLLIILAAVAAMSCASCDNQKATDHIPLNSDNDTLSYVEVPYDKVGIGGSEHEQITVFFNGVPFNILWDTGCSITSLTLDDLKAMVREGAISDEDYRNTIGTTIADGSTIPNATFNINEIRIMGDNGKKIVLNDCVISVVANGQQGSRLLGKNIINQLGDVKKEETHLLLKKK